MGTNYYLHRKAKYNPKDPILAYYRFGCSDVNKIYKLKNGLIWHDTFYPNLDELNKNYYQTIHIGKSSCGWHFSLCIYPKLNINTFDDWLKLFTDNDIYDEYGDKITVKEMIETITNRKAYNWDPNKIDALEKQQLEAHSELSNLFPSSVNTKYTSYDDLLNDNHAERGVNGLWRHVSSDYTNNPGCTYDYINGELHVFS